MPDYASQYGNVLRLREMMRLADDRQQERDRLAEEEKQRQRMRGAYAFGPQGNLDRPTTLRNFRDIDPLAALTIQQGWKAGDVAARQQRFEMDKAEQEAELAELKLGQETSQAIANLIGTATDQRTYDLALQTAVQNEWLTPEQAAQRPVFDTTTMLWIKQLQDGLLTESQKAQARQDEIVRAREKTEYEQGQLTNAMELGGQLAPVIDSQQDLDLFHKQTGGLLKDFVGDRYNPATTQRTLADITKTPQERATEAAAAEKLAATESAKQLGKQEQQAEHKQQRFEDLQSQEDKLLGQENELHAANEAIGRQLETIHQQFLSNREGETEEEKLKQEEVKDPVLERTLKRKRVELEREVNENEGRIADLQKQRATAIQRKNRVYGQAGREGAQGQVSVKAPNGKTYTFDSQAQADNFKRAAAIN